MKKIIFILIFHCLFSQVITNNSFNNSRSIALAGCVISNPGLHESSFNNPANLYKAEHSSFIAGNTFFYNREFLEYRYFSFLYHQNKKKKNMSRNNIALTLQELGTKAKDNDYDIDYLSFERSIGISQGFPIFTDKNSHLSLGYTLNFFFLKQGRTAGTAGDGSNGRPSSKIYNVGLDLGLMSSLRGKIVLGAFIKNINSPSIGGGSSSSQFLPRRLGIGFSYLPMKTLITSFNYERTLGMKDNQFRFSFEYKIHKSFEILAGVQMKPNRFGFGFTSSANDKTLLSYAILTHPIMPLTHNIELGLIF